MSLLQSFVRSLSFRADSGGGGSAVPPWDDSWFSSRGYQTATGIRVSPESALRIAAVFACLRVVSETVASLPLIIYRRLPNGGKERAVDHPLYRLLHDAPNQWQTAYEFLEMMQGHLELRGNAYALIVSGNGRAIDALLPVHPDRVVVKRMRDTGRLRYEVRNYYNGSVEFYAQEEMLHLRGLSSDGLVGMSTISVMAESIGAGLAAQEYSARFFENDSTPSGVLSHAKTLSDAAYNRLKNSWREQQAGINQHSLKILEEDMKYENIGFTNTDSQLLEARQFSRSDIASGFRVPLHKIGDLTRATFSNIEQQNIEFATDCIRPRLVRLERRINMTLIDPLEYGNGEEYFSEFLMEALLRGDLKSRYSAYAIGRNWGWLSANDVRSAESMNPIEGGDIYLQPLNTAQSGEADNPDETDESTDKIEDSTGLGARARLYDYVEATAARVVRKETKALTRFAEKANGHFAEHVTEFYRAHREFVAESMRIAELEADLYVRQNERAVQDATVDARATVIRDIEAEGPRRLLKLALGTKALAPSAQMTPLQVRIEPQTINVTPQINVAAPSIAIQPMDVKMIVEQAPSRPKKVTAERTDDGKLVATVAEEPQVVSVRALPSKDGVTIDA
jgi:HK97 family phage portal protein